MIRVFRWAAIFGCALAVCDTAIELFHTVAVYVETGAPEYGRGFRGLVRTLSGSLTRSVVLFVLSALLYIGCEIVARLPLRFSDESEG